jgi:TetR/AcrR family transcriptional repressor of bet genes
MARPSNTEERRARIVDAMLRVMARHGYAKASVGAVAREAGLSPGLLHYHFENKQAILLALIDRLAAGLHARYERLAADADEPRERVMAWIDAHLARGDDADPDAVACWVALGNEALSEPEVRAAYERVVRADLDRLQELVRAAIGKRRTKEAGRMAAGLLAAVEGAFRLAVLAPDLIPHGSAAATVRQMAEGLLLHASEGGAR